MKHKILRHLCRCIFFALATTAMADSTPIWLTTTNTVTAPAGTLVQLKALADANPSPQYSWLTNSVPISGATSNSYTLTVSTVTASLTWSIVASNYLGRSTNGPFYVRIPTGTQTSNVWGNGYWTNGLGFTTIHHAFVPNKVVSTKEWYTLVTMDDRDSLLLEDGQVTESVVTKRPFAGFARRCL